MGKPFAVRWSAKSSRAFEQAPQVRPSVRPAERGYTFMEVIVALALLSGAPLPILPLQILYLNMIGDVFPALALGVGKGDSSKLKRPPRDAQEPILIRGHWIAIGGYGLVIAVSVLAALWIAINSLGMETDRAVTVSFPTLAFARLWHVFNMRERNSRVIKNDVTANPFVWGALGLCSALLLGALYLPGISQALHMVPPGPGGWGVIFGMSLVPLLAGQISKAIMSRKGSGKKEG